MDKQILINIVGCIFCVSGFFDALKYVLQGLKVHRMADAKTISRQFLNYAIINDVVKLIYGILIWDIYVTGTSILALGAMFYMFWEVYLHYPYETYPREGHVRPGLGLYVWNSLLPNRIRKHL